MANLFEAGMILLFGIAWPVSIIKSFRARTAKGKSMYFLLVIELGYVCGIISKLLAGNVNYLIVFYIINSALTLVDILLYIRNWKLDNKKSL
jgi:hypothetical protein